MASVNCQRPDLQRLSVVHQLVSQGVLNEVCQSNEKTVLVWVERSGVSVCSHSKHKLGLCAVETQTLNLQ